MNYEFSRRHFLQGATALGLGAQASALGLSPPQDPREAAPGRSVVLIYLRGGADFLNMIVPLKDRTYELVRPGIGISREQLVPLDSHWALHPSLKPLLPFYKEGLFAPVINTGSPHPTRSHFDAQDFMNYAAPGDRTVHDGWLNRYLAATSEGNSGEFRAVGMQRLLPTALRGEFPVLAVPDNFEDRRSGKVLDYFEKFYGAEGRTGEEGDDGEGDDGMGMERERDEGVDVRQSGKVTIETLRRFSEIIGRSTDGDLGYPRSSLGVGLKRIGQVLRAREGLEVAAIDVNGWDHHANQGGAQGAHAAKLANLAGSLAAFRRHLGKDFESTLVLVMTEFGRTVLENGSGGTDHGHGSGMLILGGGLKGGKVHGEWTGLKADRLYQGRDLPVRTDYRDVLYTVLREHLDFKAPKDFFPDYKPARLKLFA
jgi:uncharacterized protein (DUF1501 family)